MLVRNSIVFSLSLSDTYLGIEACVYFAGTAVNLRRESLNRTEVPYPLDWFAVARALQLHHRSRKDQH